MTNPYPLPRSIRQTEILVGDGGSTYGPFAGFQIFDVADVEVWTKPQGADRFSLVAAIVAKVSDLPFDFFTINVPGGLPATTHYVVRSARLHERTAGVTSGTRVDLTALEKELSKQGVVLQEIRRELSTRIVSTDFGDAEQTLPSPDGISVLGWDSGGKLVNRKTDGISLLEAQAAAAAALAAANAGFKFGTEADFEAANIPLVLTFIETAGYYAPGDGGGHQKRRIPAPDPVMPWHKQSADGAWWEVESVTAGGRRIIYAAQFGIVPGHDVTAPAKALYASLAHAEVNWSPGSYSLTDYIGVYGENVISRCPSGRHAITIRQLTWGLPVFSTADPDNPAVRPRGVKFYDLGGEAWCDGVKCYFYDSFYPVDLGVYRCEAHPTTTAAEIFLLRNGVLEEPASISGLGTDEVTITLSSPQLAGQMILIKVTNKRDLHGQPAIWGQGKAAESALIFHGGGDDFRAERLHVEGFVAQVAYFGDWTSQLADAHSYSPVIRDITFDNCDFVLLSEAFNWEVDQIIGGKVSETQTDTGLVLGQAPIYKDPHVLYVTDRSTLAVTQKGRVGVLSGDNKYSSNYKARNVRGLVVEAGATYEFFRHLDIEQVQDTVFNFPVISGAFNGSLDGQRAALNLWACSGVTINVDRMYVTSDIAFVARFRKGLQNVCSQCTIVIRDLYITASAVRSNDWFVNHGGVDCWVIIENLYILDQMGGYLYRAREEDISSPALFSRRGGIKVKNIHCTNAIDLKLAAFVSNNGVTHPSGVTADFDLDAITNGKLTAATFDLRGADHKPLFRRSGAQVIPFTVRTNGTVIISYSNSVALSVAAIAAGQYRVTHNLGHANYAVSVTVERDANASRFAYVDNETNTTFDIYISDGANFQDAQVRCVLAAKAYGFV
ncbi:hypothetical protein [Rhizobium halophilum]|uniref:hypothetical protein n=1 Tax=Rhizobium halophilum TaxID=2846852 RepID=UPI001EFD575C|nr:hypothetical protein [Rhizobium halophilum]MCF6368347.1 hypothetical protein [Rhizobium halophilum]